MKAESVQAGNAVRDPAKYRPNALRNIEKFNEAVLFFRQHGHKWETSMVKGVMLTFIREIKTPEAFQNWMFRTQTIHRNLEPVQET